MENLAKEICTYLISNGVGTAGKTLFIGGFAGKTDNQIAVQQTGGLEPYKDIPVSRPTIQISVRDKGYLAGARLTNTIMVLLDKKDDSVVLDPDGEIDVMQINALAEPQYLGQDTEGRHLFTINFVFMIRRYN